MIVGCAASNAHRGTSSSDRGDLETEAREFLAFYEPTYRALYTERKRAEWEADTDVSDVHTGQRMGADGAFAAFVGSPVVLARANALLAHEGELGEVTVRELREILYLAAGSPQTNAALSRELVSAEARQRAILNGFQFCLERGADDTCARPTTTNELDRILVSSRDLAERRRAWDASQAVGGALREGLDALRDLRNATARETGYHDFFALRVANYGMRTDEMIALLDELVVQTRPLYEQIHCYARHVLAERYHEDEGAGLIPAHWLGNRWAQRWPGLVEGVDMNALLADRSPAWIVEQAERFYVSLGFDELPDSFWTSSDLYPVASGESRRKSSHPTAWHIDLDGDVRSNMSMVNDWRWFTIAHHELGHIYYYLSYARPEVPYVLRQGANRSFHEGIGELMAHAASQEPYLRQVGILANDARIDETQWLLDSALIGPIVFLPFCAGVVSRFERDLYVDDLPQDQWNARWWEYVARYQGLARPPGDSDAGCAACTKTHLNDDPAEYYDYILANVLAMQLHDHICRNILGQPPRACSYFGHTEVGDFLGDLLESGRTRDWRELLQEKLGRGLTAEPMLDYYQPLLAYLREVNQGRDCSLP